MKFIDSSYDEKEGISCVTMQHLGKKFTDFATVHPDDKENASSYAGCEYAEIRATIRALKYERKIAKQKADEAIDFMKSCTGYAKFDKNSDTAKVMYRQMNQRIKRVNDLTDMINELMDELDKKIHRRAIVTRAIERKKGMSKEDK